MGVTTIIRDGYLPVPVRMLPLDSDHMLSQLLVSTHVPNGGFPTKGSKIILGPDSGHHVQITISCLPQF